MDVSTIGNNTQASTNQASGPALGRDDFMKLLVAQLAHQDPLSPLDDKEFVAQLAQFSGLEQMTEVNQRLSALQTSQTALSNAQIAGLIGREVSVQSDTLEVSAGTPAPPVQFQLASAAAATTVKIVDAQGRVVRTLDAGALEAGARSISWDGRSDTGTQLDPGVYHVEVAAVDADGAAIAADMRSRGVVTGVAFDSGFPELMLGDRRVRPADVIQVLGV